VRVTFRSKFTVDRFSRSEIILHASADIDFYERPKKNHVNVNIIHGTNLQVSTSHFWIYQVLSSTLPLFVGKRISGLCEILGFEDKDCYLMDYATLQSGLPLRFGGT
jgi:hypothetical protein